MRSAAAASGGATGECVADGLALCAGQHAVPVGTVSLLFHRTHARRAGSGGLCESVGSGARVLGGAMVVGRAAEGGGLVGGSGGGSDRVMRWC